MPSPGNNRIEALIRFCWVRLGSTGFCKVRSGFYGVPDSAVWNSESAEPAEPRTNPVEPGRTLWNPAEPDPLDAVSVSDFGRGSVEVRYAGGGAGDLSLAANPGDHVGEIAIADDLLPIRNRHDVPVDRFDFVTFELEADLFAPSLDRMPSRMFAEHERRLRDSDFFGPHDFVGAAILQHAVLVNSGFVREGVPPHDRLVRLHRFAGERGEQLARRIDLSWVDAGLVRQQIRSHPGRHDDFFKRCVARALANPVHRTLDLPRAGTDGRERIGDRQAKVIVAMRAERRMAGVGHAREHGAEEF